MSKINRGRKLFAELSDLVAGKFELLSAEFLKEFPGLTLHNHPDQFIESLEKEISRVKEKLEGQRVYMQ
jgi:hypothetical protein